MHPDTQDNSTIWKPVPGFEDCYLASNTGLLWSKRRRKIIEGTRNRKHNGYLATTLYGYGEGVRGGRGKKWSTFIHVIVATTFLSNPRKLPAVDHKDSNSDHNWVENLEWVTHAENVQRSILRGNRKQTGTDNFKARLTEADVLKIRAEYLPGIRQGWTEMMAAKYGVKSSAISKICKRRTWTHI